MCHELKRDVQMLLLLLLLMFIIIIHIAEWWCCTLFHIWKPQKGLHNVSHEAFGGDIY